jgi:hypothetical protein
MSEKSASIRIIRYADVESVLPKVVPLTNFGPPDVFICALGFESRTNAIGNHRSAISPAQKGQLAVYCEYKTNSAENNANQEPLVRFLSGHFERVHPVTADDPALLQTQLCAELAMVKCAQGAVLSVVVDISAASGNLILTLFAVLFQIARIRPMSCRVVYAEAESYFPSISQFTARGEELVQQACAPGDSASLHEFGVEDVEVNELYPGTAFEGREDLIFAIPAYRTERLSRCLKRLSNEPILQVRERILWILGQPPDQELTFRLEFQKRIINRLLQGADETPPQISGLVAENLRVTSTLDYRQTTRQLIELADANMGKTLSLVHMGSKMQGLGAALALSARSEIAVCYARPTSFNPQHYSEGVGPLWEVEFDDLGDVAVQLAKIGTLQMTTAIEGRTGRPSL